MPASSAFAASANRAAPPPVPSRAIPFAIGLPGRPRHYHGCECPGAQTASESTVAAHEDEAARQIGYGAARPQSLLESDLGYEARRLANYSDAGRSGDGRGRMPMRQAPAGSHRASTCLPLHWAGLPPQPPIRSATETSPMIDDNSLNFTRTSTRSRAPAQTNGLVSSLVLARPSCRRAVTSRTSLYACCTPSPGIRRQL